MTRITTRGITVLAGGVAETQDITRRAESAGFDAAWSGEFLHRSATLAVAAMAAVSNSCRRCAPRFRSSPPGSTPG